MTELASAEELAGADKGGGLQVVYDGECPFCSAYVRLVRLREAVGPVELLDARAHPGLVAELHAEGIDLNETMAVRYGGRTYVGAEAMEVLSLLSSDSGRANRLFARIFRDGRRARRLYPWLRSGRNLALRLLGRKKLTVPE
ncbi:MAG: thiol-disulfide oxidoreductase DCC family protein [Dichotomicrobium sp.]